MRRSFYTLKKLLEILGIKQKRASILLKLTDQ